MVAVSLKEKDKERNKEESTGNRVYPWFAPPGIG